MQTHPTTMFLVAQTRTADRNREAAALRLVDVAVGYGPARQQRLRSLLGTAVRAATELRPVFRRRSSAIQVSA